MGFKEVRGGYKGLQRAAKGSKRLEGVTSVRRFERI